MKKTIILLASLAAAASFGADDAGPVQVQIQAPAQVQVLPAIQVREPVRLTTIAAAATSNALAAAPIGDVLELANGDRLRGKFLGITPEKGLVWQHDSVREPLAVIPDRTRSLKLQRPSPITSKKPNCRLQLRNGDRLAGTMVSLDEREARLETWYGGTLAIPRAALAGLTLTKQQGEVIYQGPTSMDGWKVSSGNRAVFAGGIAGEDMVMQEGGNAPKTDAWIFKDDAFHSSGQGTLGRELKLPNLSNIEFDLEIVNYPQLAIHFYTDALDRSAGNNALVLQFSSRSVYLRRNSNTGASRTMGNSESPLGMGAKTKARVSIRTDLAQQTVAVLMDDVLIRKYTGIGKAEELGTGLMFYNYSAYAAKISNIVVSHWDGRIEDPATPATVLREDLMVLGNKDKISGQLQSIKEDKVTFNSSFSKLEVPLDRLTSLNFADPAEAAKAEAKAAKLNFFDGGRITLKIANWDENHITGESTIYGPLKLDAKAFTSAQFGP